MSRASYADDLCATRLPYIFFEEAYQRAKIFDQVWVAWCRIPAGSSSMQFTSTCTFWWGRQIVKNEILIRDWLRVTEAWFGRAWLVKTEGLSHHATRDGYESADVITAVMVKQKKWRQNLMEPSTASLSFVLHRRSCLGSLSFVARSFVVNADENEKLPEVCFTGSANLIFLLTKHHTQLRGRKHNLGIWDRWENIIFGKRSKQWHLFNWWMHNKKRERGRKRYKKV